MESMRGSTGRDPYSSFSSSSSRSEESGLFHPTRDFARPPPEDQFQADVVIGVGRHGVGKWTLFNLLVGRKDIDSLLCGGADKSKAVVDTKAEVTFYGTSLCAPTADHASEFAQAVALNRIFRRASGVKILMVVHHLSVSNNDELLEPFNYVAQLVQNINKYDHSIVLVVNKVPPGETSAFEKVVKQVRAAQDSLESGNDDPDWLKERKWDLFDAVLQNVNGRYTNIAVVTNLSTTGLSGGDEVRQTMRRLVYHRMEFVRPTAGDFGKALTPGTERQINRYTETVLDSIVSAANSTCRAMKMRVRTLLQDTDCHVALNNVQKHMTCVDNKHTAMKCVFCSSAPSLYDPNFTSFVKGEYDYLAMIKEAEGSSSGFEFRQNHIETATEEVKRYLRSLADFLRFRIQLLEAMLDYDVQQYRERYVKPADATNVRAFIHKIIQEKSIKTSLDVDNLEVDDTITSLIDSCVSVTTTPPTVRRDPARDPHGVLLVIGPVVVLSKDVLSTPEWNRGVSGLRIFAFHAVYIDEDIAMSCDSSRIEIVSPRWVIKGKRWVNLNGSPGSDADAVERTRGATPGLNGQHGLPGYPGNPGGSFFGAGKTFVDGENLRITATGGRGGAGSDGRDGHDGSDAHIVTVLSGGKPVSYEDVNVYGGKGGDGGNGGMGGLGGSPGPVQVVDTGSKGQHPVIVTIATRGEQGAPGRAGQGGKGGRHGRLVADFECTKMADDGQPGKDGKNTDGQVRPKTAATATDPSALRGRYKEALAAAGTQQNNPVLTSCWAFVKELEALWERNSPVSAEFEARFELI